jgi:hypothetical protein
MGQIAGNFAERIISVKVRYGLRDSIRFANIDVPRAIEQHDFVSWVQLEKHGKTGCSAAWLAHLLWEQGVGGSNPLTPTSLFP